MTQNSANKTIWSKFCSQEEVTGNTYAHNVWQKGLQLIGKQTFVSIVSFCAEHKLLINLFN